MRTSTHRTETMSRVESLMKFLHFISNIKTEERYDHHWILIFLKTCPSQLLFGAYEQSYHFELYY